MSAPGMELAAGNEWGAGWEAHRQHQLTMGLTATPAHRLRRLEEMIALAYRAGARRTSDRR